MNPRRLLGAFGALWLAGSASAAALSPRADTVDTASFDVLTKGADAQVQSVIDTKASALRDQPRALTRQVRRLVTPFVWPQSTYHHDESLIPHIDEMLAELVQRQHDDGGSLSTALRSPA